MPCAVVVIVHVVNVMHVVVNNVRSLQRLIARNIALSAPQNAARIIRINRHWLANAVRVKLIVKHSDIGRNWNVSIQRSLLIKIAREEALARI